MSETLDAPGGDIQERKEIDSSCLIMGTETASVLGNFPRALATTFRKIDTLCLIPTRKLMLDQQYTLPTIDSRGIRGQIRYLHFLIQNIRNWDTYIIVWAKPYAYFYLDFILLWLFRRKVYMVENGDDVRIRFLQNHFSKKVCGAEYYAGMDPVTLTDVRRLFRLLAIELFRFFKITNRNTRFLFMNRTAFFRINISVSMSALRQNRLHMQEKMKELKNGATVRIVHAPTERKVKGTDTVLKAVEILKQRGHDFEFDLIENLPHKELRQRLPQAHLLIDQPGSLHGTLALEGLSEGLVVFGGNDDKLESTGLPSPVIHFVRSPNQLADLLEKFLLDFDLVEEYSRKSLEYFEQYYSVERLCEYYKDVFEGRVKPMEKVSWRTLMGR